VPDPPLAPATPLELFDRVIAARGPRPLIHARRGSLSADDVDAQAGAIAAALVDAGVARGDRVGLYLQNDPEYVIALLAVWRVGAIAVACSPMLRERELTHHLADSGAVALICLDELYRAVAGRAVAGLGLRLVLTAQGAGTAPADTLAFEAALRVHDGAVPAPAPPAPGDVAVLTYTSGTTGPAKAAMNSHANIAYAAAAYQEGLAVTADDVILGIAPLYHVTGLTAHVGLALATGAALVLDHRFDAARTARLIEHHRATVTVAAITAYSALANEPQTHAFDLSSLRRPYSGGAPIAPAQVDSLQERLGIAIRPVYGLTETTGPTHLAPVDGPLRVDAASGALSVGPALPGTTVRIVDEQGETVAAGDVGEVAVRGPQVVAGYWCQPEETRLALPDGELRTGDVGRVDEDGWLYLIDRRKDMIVASGFKVWPREVEDVLHEHADVHEAAVIGAPDAYRGETVWAFVVARAGRQPTPQELIDHCRERLAAYKVPRRVELLDALPRTASGKVLRRALRDLPPAPGERAGDRL
jgi:long-chain acyl-CoA synthetase